jgi:hypothetical protein
VLQLAKAIRPHEFAEALLKEDATKLLSLTDTKGDPFFDSMDVLKEKRSWDAIFELQTMTLEDGPRLTVREKEAAEAKPFDALSAGQQRSVLLSRQGR